MSEKLTIEALKIGGRYNWKHQAERLIYMGKIQDHRFCRGWYQFALVDAPNKVWCEVRPEDIDMFEETK